MVRYEYFILEDGTRTYTRPELNSTSYKDWVMLSADEDKILQHKKSGRKAHDVTVLADYEHLWIEVEDKPE